MALKTALSRKATTAASTVVDVPSGNCKGPENSKTLAVAAMLGCEKSLHFYFPTAEWISYSVRYCEA